VAAKRELGFEESARLAELEKWLGLAGIARFQYYRGSDNIAAAVSAVT